jgi:RNA polymerase sigma-70 factor (ECF subfamily)
MVAQLWRAYRRFDERTAFSTWMYRIAVNVAILFHRSEIRLIENLDELNRALMLLYLDDKPYAEIAAILGISETNVATKISRIKQRLKRDVGVR